LTKKKEKFEKIENGSALSFLYEDRIETVDREKGGKLVTARNKFTGATSTVLFRKPSDVIIELHAKIVVSKWGRPSEADMLSRLFK
jgi:hypothetical protein